MLLNNRVIWKNAAALVDLSVVLNNYHSGTQAIDFIALDDALYIGSDMPFNHRYIDVSVVNDQSSVVSVEIWNGSEFIPAVDVIDQTSVGGKSLAQSGIISWVPDREESGWSREGTTEDIVDLATLKIYDTYWVRIKFSADLKATTALKYVGHKFASDEDFGCLYPDLVKTETKEAFATGKTNWTEQLVAASEIIIKDLRQKRIIFSRNQVLNWELFSHAACHQLAIIVFRAFGDDYKDNFDRASKDYWASLNLKSFEVDKNMDGRLSVGEQYRDTEILRR